MSKMMIVHQFEETVLSLFEQGLIHGTIHLGIGEEAAAIGTTAALKKEDYLLATHRGHGPTIGKGVDIKAMMAELLGRETGTNHGKGGSMHICDCQNGILGGNGVLGANAPIACGAALTIQTKKIPDRVSACFFGDGASNEGAIHESMNLAATWNLPVLFVLTNNTYAVSTPLRRAVRDTDLTKRALPYDMKAFECDGNDVLAVYKTVSQARQYAVEGNGPVLIVEHTYRTSGHSKSDDNCYRAEEEIQYWRDHGPIVRFREVLVKEQKFTAAEIDEIQADAVRIIEEAVAYAKEQPQPRVEDLEADVYAD